MIHPPDLPRRLHATLAARLPSAPPPEAWQPLTGGRSNLCWRLPGPGGEGAAADDLVLKLYRPDQGSALFPNDAGIEAATLAALRGQDLAPDLVDQWQDPLGPCLLYRHLPGPTWRQDPAAVARLLRRLHDLPPSRAPEALRRVPDGPAALRAAILAALPAQPAQDSAEQASLRATLHRLPDPGPLPPARAVLLHGDPVPGNIVMTPGGARLIDWQCPALGDPGHDLALFLSPAMMRIYRGQPLSEAERNAFLAAYGAPDTRARLTALAPLRHLWIAAYCLARARTAAPQEAALDIAAARDELAGFDPVSG
ncbi:phosphotransferase family protein [Pseudooceanicola sp. 200-1SW]|uniref:phosphotransferase family protein n=1 Tax=Pseudooceanicola sp. 200-1SW TaxID=3425949 RepID=UPI003D7F6BA6